ncbi:DUF3095 domain-containing protein [Mesorhizobium marinum]|uniref:DUF3095 domain-containing protein n=1 Tax=Mesorhizobium marinum TaxID=3228790 RepID=UPI003467D362
MTPETAIFTRSLPVGGEFRAVLDGDLYRPAPDDWLIAVSDVVGSRKAIAAGRYKAVNMAGVALISALMNALETQQLPYIFGGDGAAIICSPADRDVVADAMARTAAWVRDDLGLELRAALVPVSVVRAEGYDVQVQATRVSEAVNNYAFRGGGLSRAEALMKKGEYAVAPAPPGSRPDLTGLSCRWSPIKPDDGKIVSIIIEPGEAAGESFPAMAETLLNLVGMQMAGGGSPVPKQGPSGRWPPEGLEMEARATRGEGSLALRRIALYVWTLFAWIILTFGLNVGSFNARHYREFTSLNTDYRKFQDGLRVTASLGETELARLNEFLEGERVAKRLRYGLCVQDSAILTCYVPSATSDSHFHFLDGAGGGYAQAAENMKS